jgi:Tol biopolymer transport system component
MATGKSTAVTNDMPPDAGPIWSPDGRQIYYTSLREQYQGIYRKAADGSGSEEFLFRYTPGAGVQLSDVSADGKLITFSSGGLILVVPLTGSDPLARKAIEFSREEFDTVQGRFSPDGRLMAYGSNEADPMSIDVYVRPFDAATGMAVGTEKWRVSKDGANGMLYWRADSKELYWIHLDIESGDAMVMAADISTTPSFKAGEPRVLFRLPNAQQTNNSPGAVSRDGQRFVFTLMDPPTAAAVR